MKPLISVALLSSCGLLLNKAVYVYGSVITEYVTVGIEGFVLDGLWKVSWELFFLPIVEWQPCVWLRAVKILKKGIGKYSRDVELLLIYIVIYYIYRKK